MADTSSHIDCIVNSYRWISARELETTVIVAMDVTYDVK